MICKRCATAADLIAQMHKDEGTGYFTGVNDFRARDFISVARTLHKLCEDQGGCDCQHQIRELPKPTNNSGESISKEEKFYTASQPDPDDYDSQVIAPLY